MGAREGDGDSLSVCFPVYFHHSLSSRRLIFVRMEFYDFRRQWIWLFMKICRHKVHVGWDQDGGFSQETYDGEPMDESILTLLRAAGQNPDRMTKEDLDFSYRFITDYQKTTQSPVVPPPPPPLMQQNTQRFDCCLYVLFDICIFQALQVSYACLC